MSKKVLAIVCKWNKIEHGGWYVEKLEKLFEHKYITLHILNINQYDDIIEIMNSFKEINSYRELNPRLTHRHKIQNPLKISIVNVYDFNTICFSIDKTYLLEKIQKKWKKYFKKKYFSVNSRRYIEIYGKYPIRI